MYSAEGLGFDCHMWPWAWTEQRAWTGEGGMWTHRWESEAMSQLVAVVFVSQSWSRGAKWSRNSQLHSLRPIMKGVRCAPVWLLFSVLMLRALHVDASIHTYKNGKFAAESNAFIYWGGNEGLYASSNHVQGQGAANGRSFISFESVTFTRTEEAAKMHEPGTTNSQYMRNWKDILQLQNCISAVIALGMSEMALWYFDYLNFNMTGSRPMGITMWAVTVGAVKKTVSRLLILVVSMGFGVVRPTLGGLTSKVLLLGGTYFLAAESLDVVENVNTINDPPGKERLFLVLPVAMLDALFILWTFTSLSRTLEKLQARRRFAKLELYRKFTNSLAMAVVVSVAWIGYELYFKATDPFGERWQSFWVIPAFWYVLAFILLIVICVLWAPSQNSTRYAYSEEVGEDLDEEEVALTASTTATKPSLIVEIEKSGVKPDSKERKSVNTDVFSLDDDLEEDKRD
uniref:GOST seven transmembrane domain-containing protein n=1 Tax=Physcomitrium patens TaxID=3218 RepID=A0A7I4D0Z7_PHYPA